MSHSAYFSRLKGKTVKTAEHMEDGCPPHTNRESIVLTFEDGTKLVVFSLAESALDSLIFPD